MEDEHTQLIAPERQERRDARENRQLLLKVAKQLFASAGVAATSMKDIAEAAGVGKGTLYRHFAHKGEICVALLKEDVAAFQERFNVLIENAMDDAPLALIDLLITEKIRMTETHLPLFAGIDEAGGGGRTRPFRGQFGAWTHTVIVRLLGAAVERGEVPHLDLEFTADAILAAMSPQLYSYQRHECGYSVERTIEGMRRLFVDGLRQGPPTGVTSP
jgi:AcrR family transcriptional regulator